MSQLNSTPQNLIPTQFNPTPVGTAKIVVMDENDPNESPKEVIFQQVVKYEYDPVCHVQTVQYLDVDNADRLTSFRIPAHRVLSDTFICNGENSYDD